MSRPSACKDPNLWPSVVIRWCEGHFKTRPAPTRPDLASQPHILSERFLYELPDRINLAKNGEHHGFTPNECKRHALDLVRYYYEATKAGGELHPLMVTYMEEARLRYCADRKHNIEKALGLVRGTRGRRRVVPHAVEIGERVLGLVEQDGHSEKSAVLTAAEDLPRQGGNQGLRRVYYGLAAARRERAERDRVMKKPYRRGDRGKKKSRKS